MDHRSRGLSRLGGRRRLGRDLQPRCERPRLRALLAAPLCAGALACSTSAAPPGEQSSGGANALALSEPKGGAAGSIEAIYAAPGPSAVARATVRSAWGISLYELFYPAAIGHDGVAYPLLIWGNGTGATVDQYTGVLTHMASWGFVVIASTSSNTGSGRDMLASLDWLVAANDDPSSTFHGALDITRIGAFGHSQGAGGSMRAFSLANAAGSGHRAIPTVLPIDLPAQKWICFGALDLSCLLTDWYGGSDVRSGSVFFINGGSNDFISPSIQALDEVLQQSISAFYGAVPAGTPKIKATLTGANHNDIQDDCALLCGTAGPKAYLGYVAAWMRYQLIGDPFARLAFVPGDAPPEIFRNGAWTNQAAHGLE